MKKKFKIQFSNNLILKDKINKKKQLDCSRVKLYKNKEKRKEKQSVITKNSALWMWSFICDFHVGFINLINKKNLKK